VCNSGSLGLFLRVWFLSFILTRMFMGSGECLHFIMPFGMLCLSAVSMAFVSVLLAW